MREISRDAPPYAFIIKALREAAGELIEELAGVGRRQARRRPEGEWSFVQIAVHVRDSERTVLNYVECISARRRPILEAADIGTTVEDDSDPRLDVERAAYQYADLREHLLHELWQLSPAEWERSGLHPYRGPLSVIQLAREQHLHDLEHLWQVRKHKQLLALDGGR